MKKNIAVFALLCMITSIAIAQNDIYSVYFYSGEIFVKQNNKSVPIVRDMIIDKNTILNINKNSSIVIVNKQYVPLAVIDEGQLTYVQISKKYTNMKATNINEEYFNYLVSSMTNTDNKQHSSGGVYKNVIDFDDMSFSPKLYPQSDIVLVDDTLSFSWKNIFGDTCYLKIANNVDDLYPIIIPSTEEKLLVDFRKLQLEHGKTYIWTVENKEGAINLFSPINTFTLASDDLKFYLNAESEKIMQNSPNEEIKKMALIRLYCDNKIFPFPKFN